MLTGPDTITYTFAHNFLPCSVTLGHACTGIISVSSSFRQTWHITCRLRAAVSWAFVLKSFKWPPWKDCLDSTVTYPPWRETCQTDMYALSGVWQIASHDDVSVYEEESCAPCSRRSTFRATLPEMRRKLLKKKNHHHPHREVGNCRKIERCTVHV